MNSEATQKLNRRAAVMLRSAFTKNLPLKIIAFVLSFVLWFMVTGGPKFETSLTLLIDLTQHIPEGWSLAEDYAREVTVTLEGTQDAIRRFMGGEQNSRDIYFTPRSNSLRPESSTQRLQILPQDFAVRLPNVRVRRVNPSEVIFRLDEKDTRNVPISLQIAGQLPEGYVLHNEPRVDPDSILVSGARSRLDRKKSFVIPFDLSGVQINETVPSSTLVSLERDPLLSYSAHQVEVELDIVEVSETKRIRISNFVAETGLDESKEQLSSLNPQTMNWDITGPKSWIEKLKAADVSIALDATGLQRNKDIELPITQGMMRFTNTPIRRELVSAKYIGNNLPQITFRITNK